MKKRHLIGLWRFILLKLLMTSVKWLVMHFVAYMYLASREYIQLGHFIFKPAPWSTFRSTVYRIRLLFSEEFREK